MSEPKFTRGPWFLCHHLKSIEHDQSCSCGYRGGILGGDQEHVVCEMGATDIPGEGSLPRYDRTTEIANAHLIHASPDLFEALKALIGDHGGSIGVSRTDERAIKARSALAKALGEDL